MMTSTRVRVPQVQEANALAFVHNEAWRETYASLFPEGRFGSVALAQRERMWSQILSSNRPNRVIRVAETEGDIVGFALAGPAKGSDAPRELELYMIYLRIHAQGTGAGQMLIDEVLGDSKAILWVAEKNPRDHAFYRRNNFRPDGSTKTDPDSPEVVEVRFVR
ncbi:GNAT family N-acetyltransferase [Arthrobacter antibioticus]|uniref:GNAT family N-acetyltransferase n=1 Tax=Arthrobacter sp. H35-MC1 TaxID=3046203 RepID=UPI0024BAF3B8|nr:GNAT family N-acetyltransferase [Arthrobacter sp. H35-MC1]MDJ0317575.1 GNAT family N-acetyltransferase [Arthrobacter sp. H35-MC1]